MMLLNYFNELKRESESEMPCNLHEKIMQRISEDTKGELEIEEGVPFHIAEDCGTIT